MTNIETNQIYLKTGTCRYLDGNYIDIEGRYTFWKTILNDNCRFNNYDVLYEKKQKKIINKLNDKLQIIYFLSTQGVTFAFT